MDAKEFFPDSSASLPSHPLFLLILMGFISKMDLSSLSIFLRKLMPVCFFLMQTAASEQHVTRQRFEIKKQLTDLMVSMEMLPLLVEQQAGGAALSFRSC